MENWVIYGVKLIMIMNKYIIQCVKDHLDTRIYVLIWPVGGAAAAEATEASWLQLASEVPNMGVLKPAACAKH